MIDTWMIFTMFYPFCVVTLYSVLQFLKTQNQNFPVPMKDGKEEWKIKKITGTVNFLLDFGLPVIVLIFIIIFWVLGIINRSSELKKSCWRIKSFRIALLWMVIVFEIKQIIVQALSLTIYYSSSRTAHSVTRTPLFKFSQGMILKIYYDSQTGLAELVLEDCVFGRFIQNVFIGSFILS